VSAAASSGLGCALALRLELSQRNQKYAAVHGLPHALSYGEQPVVCFEPYENGTCHGNFLPATYRAILKNENWRRRLAKAHSQARAALPRTRAWKELDSSNSSDALLMNVFCYPGVFRDGQLHGLLGVERGSLPEFGIKARVPLAGGKFDRTEVDMRIGALLVEAKLTEADFQTQDAAVVENYRDFAEVFERRLLPRAQKRYASYQLIRSVLAAHAGSAAGSAGVSPAVAWASRPRRSGSAGISPAVAWASRPRRSGSAGISPTRPHSFCVLCDARRPDLLEAWYAVMRWVRGAELRVRCKVLTWQELASVLPSRLRDFLDEKYGIVAGDQN
jgi:hypothetical protein